MKTETIIRMLRFFANDECQCKGALVPYPDGSLDCPHTIARKELTRLAPDVAAELRLLGGVSTSDSTRRNAWQELGQCLKECRLYADAPRPDASDASDELSLKDVADGYREGYQRLHGLVCRMVAPLGTLLGER
jgi:hypothetical protein